MDRTIRVRLTRDEARRMIHDLPGAIVGRSALAQESARGMALRLGVVTMSFLKEAFLIKARGGVDATGMKWAPLSPYTIRKRLEKGPTGVRYLPLKVRRAMIQFEKAKATYTKAAARLGGFKKASAKTTERAKAKVDRLEKRLRKYTARLGKAETALQTAIAGIEILRDTGRMYNSLSPGEAGELNEDGILIVNPGEIVFGTNVEYAPEHMEGRPVATEKGPPMPARPLWPEPAKWPADWWNQLSRAAADGAVDVAASMLTGGAL